MWVGTLVRGARARPSMRERPEKRPTLGALGDRLCLPLISERDLVWPARDRTTEVRRLIGESIYEPERRQAEIIKLTWADALTTEADRLLVPFQPLPSFDEMPADIKAAHPSAQNLLLSQQPCSPGCAWKPLPTAEVTGASSMGLDTSCSAER